MATGDVFESLHPRDLVPQNGLIQDPHKLRAVGPLGGYPLRKAGNDGVYVSFKVPNNGTPLPTGITVEVTTVDDQNTGNGDPGKVFRLGVSGAKVVSGTTNLTTVAMGAETTADVTANATSGIATITSLAITKANLGTPVAGDIVILFLRRVGTHANDTHGGEVLVTNVVIKDT